MSKPQDKPVDTASTASTRPGLDAAVEYLVQQRLLLTALELNQELLERGEENKTLTELFTTGKLLDELNDNASHPLNQQLVRRPVARNTNTYQEMDSRVALLEYELRQERQTTQALRQELSLLWNRKKKEDQGVSEGEAAYSQLEKRALSYLIKKFLLDQRLKLTAISLTEELEDSMDTWTSVGQMFGINTKEPPSLMSIYRYFYNSGENKYEFGFKDALDKATRDNAALKEQLKAKDDELLRVKRDSLKEIEALHAQLTQLDEPVQAVVRGEIISLDEFKSRVTQLKSVTSREQPGSSLTGVTEKINAKDKKDNKPSEHKEYKKRVTKKRDLTALFPREEVSDDTSKRISEQVTKLRVMEENKESVIDVLSTALPHIVSGVILKKREELIPVLLMAIRFHPVEEKRTQLTQLLFNLVKIPTEHQRKSILDGWEWLAQLQGPDRVAQELLPSCWEQINNKYAERRVLVAECAGRLGNAVTAEMRASLLVSIVTSLLADSEAPVRRSATSNLARLLLPRPDDIDAAQVDEKKYKDLRDLLMKTLHDNDVEVKNIARQILLPVFADWAEREEFLFPKFANSLLDGIATIVNRLASFKRQDKGKRIEAKDTRELELHCQLLNYVLKHGHDSVMTSAPFYRNEELDELHDTDVKLPLAPHLAAASSAVGAAISPSSPVNSAASSGADYLTVFKLNERQFIRKKFDDFIATLYSPEDNYKTWIPFDWMINDLLNRLMSYVTAIDTCYGDVVYQLTNVVATLCVTFTPSFTERVVKSKIERQLKQINTDEEDTDVREMKRERLVQFYLVGVLSHLNSEVLMAFLKELLMNIALGEKGWSTKSIQLLSDSVVMICQQSMEKKEQILNMLWDLVVNPSSEVRFVVIKVMQAMITILTHNELMNRVLPALVTMSSDPDRKVRMGTIKTFTHLATNTTDETVLAKVSIPLESFLNDSNPKTVVETLNTLVPIIPNVSSKFRDSFILSTMIKVTENNNSNKKESERREVANALFETYRAFNGVRMNKETTQQFIRGLKALQRDVDLLGQNRSLLGMMVTDMEKALQSANKDTLQPAASNPLGINLSMLGLGGTATPLAQAPNTAGGTPNTAQPNDPNAHGFMGNMLSYFKMN